MDIVWSFSCEVAKSKDDLRLDFKRGIVIGSEMRKEKRERVEVESIVGMLSVAGKEVADDSADSELQLKVSGV